MGNRIRGSLVGLLLVAAWMPGRSVEGQTVYDELRQCTSIAWVGAHADDEIFIAPLFAHLCREPGATHGSRARQCHMIYLTRSQDHCPTAHCRRICPQGSAACFAALRLEELTLSANLLGATLTRFDYDAWKRAPSPGAAVQAWTAQKHETYADLVAKVGAEMETRQVDCLLAFDPRHGSTCHNEHRAAGQVAIDAAEALLTPLAEDQIFHTEAHYVPYLQTTPSFQWCGFQSPPLTMTDPNIEDYDATVTEPWGEGGAPLQMWRFLTRVVEIHASQFGGRARCTTRRTEPADRIVPMLRHPDYDPSDPLYAGLCEAAPPFGQGGSCAAETLALCSGG